MNWAEFHFLRPEWLFAIPVLIAAAFLLARWRRTTAWEVYIPREKLEFLSVGKAGSTRTWKWLLLTSWLISAVALSGPSWEKTSQSLLKNREAMIILLDLSPSMLAQDITPDRVTRARLKLIDLLRMRTDGETALIAYAGDPHRVSPLTDDTANIEALVPSLYPGIMPLAGSTTETAVEMAIELFEDAAVSSGDILLITDGVEPDAADLIIDILPASYRMSILGVGTREGAPIPLAGGGFLRDSGDEIIVAALNRSGLRDLAAATAGRYVDLQANESDLESIMDMIGTPMDAELVEEQAKFDSWHDAGYWLVFLLLPFAVLAFRRNMVWMILLLPMAPHESIAAEWDNLWLRPDQQGVRALQRGDAAVASELFESEDWKAVANYRNREFDRASELFGSGMEDRRDYNHGNALALAGDLQGAIDAYDRALQLAPDDEDAAYNKEIVEKMMDQQQDQEQQDQEQQDQEQQDQEQQDQEQQDQEQQDQEQQEQEQQDQEEQEQEEQEEQEQEEQEQEEQEQEEQEQEEQEQEEQEQEEPLDPASEQWLRGIPDDPGGLLRRKFRYQSDVYRQQQRYSSGSSTDVEERY